MKSRALAIVLAFVCFAGLGAVAQAQIRPQITVKMPFQFVASGTTLPAGTYVISRVSDDPLDGLILNNYEDHLSVLVHPVEYGDARADKPSVSFMRVGMTQQLSRIETSHLIYSFSVSPLAAPDQLAKNSTGAVATRSVSGK